jgi:RimJ/RimL family protein N-acetyltransferase
MLGLMSLSLVPLQTARLRLEPVTADRARAILAGDLSGLAAGEGWPHEDTADGLAMAVDGGYPPGWLITLDGTVIGDCGIHGPVDRDGGVEIGYGLAVAYRGQGYGSEAVAAITGWLAGLPHVSHVRARTMNGNAPSRRVLEKAGFSLAAFDNGQVVYQRDSPAA